MSRFALVMFGEALLLGILAGVLWLRSRDARVSARAASRFAQLKVSPVDPPRINETSSLVARLLDQLWRAGLTPRKEYIWAAAVILLLTGAEGWRWERVFGLLVAPLIVVVGGYLILQWRHQQRAAATLRQLPMFLDQMIRALSAGRTIDSSFLHATERCTAPLRETLDRVCANLRLGVDLGSALGAVARLHELRELQLLALAIHVNTRYGGSIRDLLGSLIGMISQRERAQRELRALTGETRLSAWVLSLLPVFLACYMLAMNPGYLETMWADATGKTVLASALGMQLVGVLLLWRMIRSI